MGERKIAGVVLAGGASARMGQNKALLDYSGRPLLDHMMGLLQRIGLTDIYVSGDFKGYRCIPDSTPHQGPARAMHDVLQQLGSYDGVLFIPVDMPLLSPDVLHLLTRRESSGYFTTFPLPAFLSKPYPRQRTESVKELLAAINAAPMALPPALEHCMTNTNTPEEWEAMRHA